MSTESTPTAPSDSKPADESANPTRAPQSAKKAAADPRARAAARAAQLREHLGGDMEERGDKFYIDPRIIPDGWCYEWKRLETLGRPDSSYQVSVAQRGWEAVPRSRHPEMMPEKDRSDCIIREGMILMERPQEITDEVRANDYRRAIEQVRGKEQQLGAAPPGTFERDNKGSPLAKVKKSYESMPIPER